MVHFRSLTRQEAKAYLSEFCAENPERIDELRRRAASGGGPSPHELDLSPASLEPLWAWARPQLAWREGYRPPVGAEPPRRVSTDELEPPAQLPSWFDPAVPGWSTYSAATLWLIDGLARYFGECLVATVPSARWAVGHARRKGYAYQNHPVVSGLPSGECEPMWVVAVTVQKALTSAADEPDALTRLYAVWTGGAVA